MGAGCIRLGSANREWIKVVVGDSSVPLILTSTPSAPPLPPSKLVDLCGIGHLVNIDSFNTEPLKGEGIRTIWPQDVTLGRFGHAG